MCQTSLRCIPIQRTTSLCWAASQPEPEAPPEAPPISPRYPPMFSPFPTRPFYLNLLPTSSLLPHRSHSHYDFTLYPSTTVACTWALASGHLFHSRPNAADSLPRARWQNERNNCPRPKSLCWCVFSFLMERLLVREAACLANACLLLGTRVRSLRGEAVSTKAG